MIADEEYNKLIKEAWRDTLELVLSDTPDGDLEFHNRQDTYRLQFQTPFDDKLYMGTPQPWDILDERGHKI